MKTICTAGCKKNSGAMRDSNPRRLGEMHRFHPLSYNTIWNHTVIDLFMCRRLKNLRSRDLKTHYHIWKSKVLNTDGDKSTINRRLEGVKWMRVIFVWSSGDVLLRSYCCYKISQWEVVFGGSSSGQWKWFFSEVNLNITKF